MGSFVKVLNSIVVDGIVAEHEWIDTLPDKELWYETSYNIRGGVYYDTETNKPHLDQSLATATAGRKRKNYAGIGYRYDKERDAFISPQRYQSWKLNEDTCLWDAPIPYPDDGKNYIWEESIIQWVLYEDGELKKEEVTEE